MLLSPFWGRLAGGHGFGFFSGCESKSGQSPIASSEGRSIFGHWSEAPLQSFNKNDCHLGELPMLIYNHGNRKIRFWYISILLAIDGWFANLCIHVHLGIHSGYLLLFTECLLCAKDSARYNSYHSVQNRTHCLLHAPFYSTEVKPLTIQIKYYIKWWMLRNNQSQRTGYVSRMGQNFGKGDHGRESWDGTEVKETKEQGLIGEKVLGEHTERARPRGVWWPACRQGFHPWLWERGSLWTQERHDTPYILIIHGTENISTLVKLTS